MRMAWLLPGLVACYAPSAPSGAPCGPATAGPRCPFGLVCELQGGAEVCVRPGETGGGDAAIDAPAPSGDLDNDGVPNAIDVCPTKADPMQYDEDGDKVGDVCDPCPVSSNNADTDGDGVGNDCDPNPTTPGDKIAVFEGFNQGVPVGWTTTGTWTSMTGAVSVTVAPNVDAFLESPFTTDATGLVAAAFVTGNNVPDTNSGLGVARVAQGQGVLCGLIADNTRQITLVTLATDNFLDTKQYAWAAQTQYITGEIRDGSQYACYSVDPQGDSRNVAASTGAVPTQTRLQLRSRGIGARFLWALYVDSP